MSGRIIRTCHTIVNYVVLTMILMTSAFAGYALWDSNQIYRAADRSNYTVYRPAAEDEGKSFAALQVINTEVLAWLSVYGTNIDYPVTQGADNMKYVNTNAEGRYSLSGSIFLDSRNDGDFRNFNNILYGHHMAKKAMFGEIGSFADSEMFDAHRYGNLYYNGKDHGLEFFAFVHTDAYDYSVFAPNATGEARQVFLDTLQAKALHRRDLTITIEDHILLLSTCSSASTNGRDILVGRISDDVFEDLTGNRDTTRMDDRRLFDDCCHPVNTWLLFSLILMLIPVLRTAVNNSSRITRRLTLHTAR